jgi:hypothetical protein
VDQIQNPATDPALIAAIVRQTVAETLQRVGPLNDQRLAFTLQQAGDACGIPWTRLRDAHARGEFTARKVGRTWLVTRDELLRWLGSAS